MSFDSLERSVHDGSRFELYRFETEDHLHLWTYTTDSKPFTFNLQEYKPEIVQRSEIKQSSGESAGSRLTVKVAYDNPVAILHVPYLPPKPVLVTIYAVQRRDSGVEVKQCFVGYITSFAQKGPEVEFQVSHIIDSQQQRLPWIVHKPGCVWALYEEGCDAQKALFQTIVQSGNWTHDGSTGISSPAILSSPGPTWFKDGYAHDPASGQTRFITDQVGDTITLVYPFTGPDEIGDLILWAGCDHLPTTCKDKFDNKPNYFGFDHIGDYNPFDGGVR